MMGLRPSTAERIRRILDRSPGSEQTYGTGRWKGLRPTLVRCTSATAADTSGVGAQCYPGVIVDLEPTGTSQDDLAGGTVWLTVLGSGALPKQPREGVVYECVLTGDVEAATDDTRPRAFSASGVAAVNTDCASVSALIRLGTCMALSITEVTGACGCIDDTQTASLTYDEDEDALVSEDLIYGCPPGVLAGICDGGVGNDGAPLKWNIVVAGFGAPNTNLNQSYTLTHTTGNIWAVTRNGVTVTATRGIAGWTLSLADGSVTVTYDTAMAFCCDTITFDIDDDDGTTTPPATLDMEVATACGNGPSYTPRLERVSGDCGLCLKFSLVPTAGSGARSIVFEQVGCGEDETGKPYAEFASSDPSLCTDDAAECSANRVVVRITCTTCYATVELPSSCPCPNPLAQELCITFANAAGAGISAEYIAVLNGMRVRLQLQEIDQDATTDPENQYTVIANAIATSCGAGPAILADMAWCGSVTFEHDGTVHTAHVVFYPCCLNGLGGTDFGVYIQPPVSLAADGFLNGAAEELAANMDCPPLETFQATGTVSFGVHGDVDFTITEADADCVTTNVSWNCVPDIGCVEVFDGSGEYASETDCNADCFGSGGGGPADCPGPESWSFAFSGFTGCLADLNGTHVLAHWFTSGGIKIWKKNLTVNGFTCYIQLKAGELAGVPYLYLDVVVYDGTLGNVTMIIGTWRNMALADCCNAATLTDDTATTTYCPTDPAYGTAYGGAIQSSISLTPSGACS